MEIKILKVIGFDLGIPLSYRFLRRYARVSNLLGLFSPMLLGMACSLHACHPQTEFSFFTQMAPQATNEYYFIMGFCIIRIIIIMSIRITASILIAIRKTSPKLKERRNLVRSHRLLIASLVAEHLWSCVDKFHKTILK